MVMSSFVLQRVLLLRIIIRIISNMGCEACKIDNQNGTLNFFSVTSSQNYQHPIKGLLDASQRKNWCDNLRMSELPERNFWESNKQLYHPCFIQIKKDLQRSFPNNTFFNDKANLLKFEILLKKFALYFPKLGYTQGLNFLAGYIILAGFNENQAFQILVQLAIHENLLLIGLYEDGFPLNRLYCALFWKLLENRLPKTTSKIKMVGAPDQIWIFQWFMSFFLYSFPLQIVKPFFNYVICKKQFSMVYLALGIVNCLKQEINNLINPDQYEFFQFINNLKNLEYCQKIINIEKVISYANSITKFQLENALSSLKLNRNIYHAYFWKQSGRRQIWNSMYEKSIHERKMFQFDPKSSEYRRDREMIEHLERLILKKCKLYRSRSDSLFTSGFRASNYSLDFQNEQLDSHSHSQNMSQKILTITYTGTATRQEQKNRSLLNYCISKKKQLSRSNHEKKALSRNRRML